MLFLLLLEQIITPLHFLSETVLDAFSGACHSLLIPQLEVVINLDVMTILLEGYVLYSSAGVSNARDSLWQRCQQHEPESHH